MFILVVRPIIPDVFARISGATTTNPAARASLFNQLLLEIENIVKMLEGVMAQSILDETKLPDTDLNLGGRQYTDENGQPYFPEAHAEGRSYTTEDIRQALFEFRAAEGFVRDELNYVKELEKSDKTEVKNTQDQAKPS